MLLDRLGRLGQRLPSMQALSLIDGDGIPVESIAMQPDLDLEGLAAEVLTQLRAIDDSLRELEVGSLESLSVSTTERVIMVSSVVSGYFLLLVLGVDANLGRARFELNRARLLLEDDLR
ncbi:MAG: hypothetical protein U0002_05935 [Thermoanaerobaculia bacterium]